MLANNSEVPDNGDLDNLDEEIRLSLKSGDATVDEVRAVFSRWGIENTNS